MRLYKGAAPGTHWAQNDATRTGFHSAHGLQATPGAAVRHIVMASNPSPWTSFTSSFAIAYDYAAPGATTTTPGYVYEIDPTHTPIRIVDPIALITSGGPCHDHNGAQDLILGVAAPGLHASALTTTPLQLVRPPIGVRYSDDFRRLCSLSETQSCWSELCLHVAW